MLDRILEPEVMDSVGDIATLEDMSHDEVNAQFVDDMIEAGPIGRAILDLGTGTGLIPVELARRVPDCRIMAVDLSTDMLDQARLNIEIAGVIEQVQLDHSDAKGLDFPDDYFSCVMSNSLIHHIPEPSVVMAEILRVTRSGGLVFVRDFIRPASDAAVAALLEQYAAEDSQSARNLLEMSLRAALSADEVREMVKNLGFAQETVQVTSDMYWTWSMRIAEQGLA